MGILYSDLFWVFFVVNSSGNKSFSERAFNERNEIKYLCLVQSSPNNIVSFKDIVI